MVLGDWTRKDTLYGGEGYSVIGNGDLAEQLKQAIDRLPEFAPLAGIAGRGTNLHRLSHRRRRSATSAKAASSSATTASSTNRKAGRECRSSMAARTLKADGTLTGKRLAALVGLRDRARRVLQSQNEGWPEAHRDEARRELNRAYDRFVSTLRPDQQDHLRRDRRRQRHPPHAQPREVPEDPDAMLVMSLEDYDEVTGKATKAAIMTKDVVGKTPPVTRVAKRRGRIARFPQPARRGRPAVHRHALRQAGSSRSSHELGDLIFHDPESQTWQTADAYLSGNVRAKLAAAERAGPRYARNAEALRAVQPEDVLPGDIDARSRRAVDTRERHPGIRRRSVPCRSAPRSPSPT